MTFQKGTNAYLVGIGGIGMSALAQLLFERGVSVAGSDRAPSPATALLFKKGFSVYIGHGANNIPDQLGVLIYSDAVPEDNLERREARSRGVPELSYFEALGQVSREMTTIAVAGSHGKTTTTAMLGSMLVDCGRAPTIVVGSIMKSVGSNFVLGDPGAPFVVEACEYRDHLLHLSPKILVVTNLEWDHTDYFTTFEQLKDTFKTAVARLPKDGALVVHAESPIGRELAAIAPCRVIDYAGMEVPELPLIGEFNRANARAAKAAALAHDAELPLLALHETLERFQGTWRRFEFKGTTAKGALVYDDYAHHPTEVRKTLEAVRERFPEKKIVVAFHPHLFSRTRDLMDDFATALMAADHVVLAPIYAAREQPIPGVTSEVLALCVGAAGGDATAVGSMAEVVQALKAYDREDALLLTMGAGDIYTVADSLLV